MDTQIPVGARLTVRQEVEHTHTADRYGSGLVAVLATPALVAMMENAAYRSVEPFLAPGQGTVGCDIAVKHLRPTLPGDTVTIESEVTAVAGKRVFFDIRATDSKGTIGLATHERAVIDTAKFMERLR